MPGTVGARYAHWQVLGRNSTVLDSRRSILGRSMSHSEAILALVYSHCYFFLDSTQTLENQEYSRTVERQGVAASPPWDIKLS